MVMRAQHPEQDNDELANDGGHDTLPREIRTPQSGLVDPLRDLLSWAHPRPFALEGRGMDHRTKAGFSGGVGEMR
jgi:hypothetical protein